MSDWTPTTDEVLEDYRDARIMGDRDPDAEFYRWLKQVQAEAWDEGRAAPIKCCEKCPLGACPWDGTGTGPTNPYRQETNA